ncbi:PucR family transcriptional regulator [Streptomyces peucetius]|uniref:Helix-turn-helix domain-containing protein n=1 Tax=Streptomyces peucetius TaxID=1950 RepID=A0ABY6I4B7_STRPE|nr:PucR family transcriptional regulator [Streptomyces peucetius]UYQ61584.1 helix-turn-helix domain-containing protein [Streptomyces peucetius]
MSNLVRSRVRAVPAPHVAPHRTRSLLDAEAIAVLHRAAQVLLDDVVGLTTTLIGELREQEPAYRAAIEADASEVWQEVHQSLRHNVASLIRPRECRDIARRTSRAIGASRAERGIPLDAVLHAFRIGGAMVWQGLVDETARRHPEDVRLLVHVAADVWNFVDEHCAVVADAYREAERRMAWRRENRLRLTTAALLDGTARITDLPDASALLGVPQDGRFVVIAATDPHPHPPGPPVVLPPGTPVVWHSTPEAELGIVHLADPRPAADDPAGTREGEAAAPAGPVDPAALAAGLCAGPGVRVGIGSAVAGLAAIGEGRRLAGTALRACPRTGGVVLLDDHLPAAVVVSSPDLGRALAERVLGPLYGIDPADRDLLVDTLTVWLEAEGSAQRAATRLYCHRNTVLNRLRRFEQLTGRSLSRPSDVVEVSLALTARRLLENQG